MTQASEPASKPTENRERDFAIYLWMKHSDIDKVAGAFGLSKSRIRQIIKAVDKNYTAYSVPYWKHVAEVEAQP